jgi:hypothetical protein
MTYPADPQQNVETTKTMMMIRMRPPVVPAMMAAIEVALRPPSSSG